MHRYEPHVMQEARRLRSLGKTYPEIKEVLNLKVPKSTLSSWFKGIDLPNDYAQKIVKLNWDHLNKVRFRANEVNRIKREESFKRIEVLNLPISRTIFNKETAKIALSMLCLGEASKSRSSPSFYFGNSDPKIIVLFLELLKICFDFNLEKVRCTVQCRSDQNIPSLETFWMETTGVPKRLFYKSRIDPRSIGKSTKKSDYKGVLRIDYFDSKVRDELESLADLVYNQLTVGPVA